MFIYHRFSHFNSVHVNISLTSILNTIQSHTRTTRRTTSTTSVVSTLSLLYFLMCNATHCSTMKIHCATLQHENACYAPADIHVQITANDLTSTLQSLPSISYGRLKMHKKMYDNGSKGLECTGISKVKTN